MGGGRPGKGKLRMFRTGATLLLAALLAGCSLSGFQTGLASALMDQSDPETAREALPVFLVTVDALIADDPENAELLRSGADLYSAFAGLFPHEPERVRTLASRGLAYAERALCIEAPGACGFDRREYGEAVALLGRLEREEVPYLFSFATSWLALAAGNSDDWSVVGDLPKIEAALERVVALQEGYRQGTAQVYLGILKSLRPPSLGGKPEEARRHFERAIELSAGRNLSAKVEFAQAYARLVYDRDLHDRLLREVLEADPKEPGLTLLNVLAQRRAKVLLESGESYF